MKELEDTRIKLITNFRFFAEFMNQCTVKFDDRCPTAGVGFGKAGEVCLIINKDFLKSLTENQRVGLLIHEMMHLVMNHLTRGKTLQHKQIANIAMDVAINQYIDKTLLPTNGCFLDEINDKYKLKMEPYQHFEYYYNHLLEKAEKINVKTVDDHSQMENGNEPKEGEGQGQGESLSKELVENILESMTRKATRKAGNAPAHIQKMLSDLDASRKINWREQLRKYMGRNLSPERIYTRNRPSRRQGFKAQGYRRDYIPKVFIGFDQSGSVGDALAAAFFNQVEQILGNTTDKTEVIYFDHAIAKIEKLQNKIDKTTRYANGGTSFLPVVEYAQKHKPDLLIMFTDGYAEPIGRQRFPILWVLPAGMDGSHLTGKVLHLEE